MFAESLNNSQWDGPRQAGQSQVCRSLRRGAPRLLCVTILVVCHVISQPTRSSGVDGLLFKAAQMVRNACRQVILPPSAL